MSVLRQRSKYVSVDLSKDDGKKLTLGRAGGPNAQQPDKQKTVSIATTVNLINAPPAVQPSTPQHSARLQDISNPFEIAVEFKHEDSPK